MCVPDFLLDKGLSRCQKNYEFFRLLSLCSAAVNCERQMRVTRPQSLPSLFPAFLPSSSRSCPPSLLPSLPLLLHCGIVLYIHNADARMRAQRKGTALQLSQGGGEQPTDRHYYGPSPRLLLFQKEGGDKGGRKKDIKIERESE